jgi:hypothetical protein
MPGLEYFPSCHLTLAEGEVTGHRHRISNGEANTYFDRDIIDRNKYWLK